MQHLRHFTHTWLRRSEGLLKADMVYLAKGSFWQTMGQAASSLFSLGLMIAFANFLPKETYGLYKYILSIAGTLGVLTLTGMNRAVSQAVASGHDGALRTALIYQLKWSTLMMAGFWGLGLYYFLHGNATLGYSLMIMGLFTPLTFSFNSYGAYLEAKKQFKINNAFSAISVLVYVAGMIAAIVLSGEILWLIFTYSLTTLATTLFFYYKTLKLVPVTNHSSGEVLTYGKQLTFIGLITPIVSQLDSLIITHFWGATQLALYSLALAIPARATSFIKSLVDLGFPKIVTRTSEEIDTVYYKRILQGILMGACCAGLYMLVAPLIFTYILPQYLDSIVYSQVLALSLITAMPNRYHSILFESRKLSRLIFTNNVIQNILKIGLYLTLGVWGGLMGLTVAYVLNSVISLGVNMTMWHLREDLA